MQKKRISPYLQQLLLSQQNAPKELNWNQHLTCWMHPLMLLVDQTQVQIVVITYHPTLMKTQSLARTLVSEVSVRYYRTHVLESRVASCSFNILFIFRVKRSQQMYLHLVWHRLGSNTQNVRIIGPKGPDTLVWGFVLLHLSGVWLRELNEFKFLCFF